MAKTKRKPVKYDLGASATIGAIIIYLLILTGYSMALVSVTSKLIWLD